MITNEDVKLLRSERLTDEDDGGGRATGTAIIDNEMNNLFKDISRLDRTTGRISLRKVFAGVVTLTNDAYLGAHSILTDMPKDPRVTILLFNTDNQTDTRVAARNLVESYMAPASTATFELLGNQLAGQRAIVGVQRAELNIPEVGEVYQLVSGANNQFVRITSIETSIETFTYAYGSNSWVDFTRRRMVMELSSPLNYTFPGGEATPGGTSQTSIITGDTKSQVLSTQVADASRYYGIAKVTDAVALGALTVKVGSIYSQLVPSTSKENALTSLLAGYEKGISIEAGPSRTVSFTAVSPGAGASRTFLGTGCTPGSLTVSANGGVYSDDKAGNLKYVSGANWLSSGFIDYQTGEITMNKTGAAWTGAGSATYKPAAAVLGDAVTFAEKIELGNRGYVYTLNLSEALPRPGTLTISFMTLGKWYEIKDNGRGELEGLGSGTVDFATGAVQVTLAALPDVDSALVYSYISQADFALSKHTGSIPATQIKIANKLDTVGIRPTSMTVNYTSGGVLKTLTDNGLGVLTGDGSGVISYATGDIELVLDQTPDASTGISYTFEEGALIESLITSFSTDSGGMATFTIAGAPLKPGSVQIQFTVERKSGYGPSIKHDRLRRESGVSEDSLLVTVTDNGSGGWVGRTGTINYTTGECWLEVERDYEYNTYTYSVASNNIFSVAR